MVKKDKDDRPRRYNLRNKNDQVDSVNKPPVKKIPKQSQPKSILKKNPKKDLKSKRKPKEPVEESSSEEETDSENKEIDIEETDNESDSEENEYDMDDSFIDNSGANDQQLLTLLTNAISKKISDSMIDGEEYSDEVSESEDDKKKSSKPEKKDQKLYKKIKENVRKDRPNIQKLLQANIPFKDQCDLFEKIKVLDNMNKYTEEYLMLKNTINTHIEGYLKSDINKKEYAKFDKIENELLKEKNITMPLKYKILSSSHNLTNKRIMYEKYQNFKDLQQDNEEYAKMNEWFDWALSIPTELKQIQIKNINEDRNRFSNDLRKELDKNLYGLENIKDAIGIIVNDYLTLYNDQKVLINQDGFTGNSLSLVGNAGVGKTLIVRTLAKCLDIPFHQISMGGVHDSSFLMGHSMTYITSKPGAIVEALRRMKYLNGIIFFDELDKLSSTERGLEVFNALLHIIDVTQNKEFRDKYLANFEIDLSKIWFIYSMNDDKAINNILRDRIKPLIKVPDYKTDDKIQIVHRHLLPNTLTIYGYTKDDIDITNESIKYLVENIEEEAGVRELKQSIKIIVSKIHYLKSNILNDGTLGNIKVKFDFLNKIDITKKIMITNEIIDICLDCKKPEQKLSMYM